MEESTENKKTLETFEKLSEGIVSIQSDEGKTILTKKKQFKREELNVQRSVTDRAVPLKASDRYAKAMAEHYDNILGKSEEKHELSKKERDELYKEMNDMVKAVMNDYIDKNLGFK
jgi:ABC-type oligopeptide transport system ATPase subunit